VNLIRARDEYRSLFSVSFLLTLFLFLSIYISFSFLNLVTKRGQLVKNIFLSILRVMVNARYRAGYGNSFKPLLLGRLERRLERRKGIHIA